MCISTLYQEDKVEIVTGKSLEYRILEIWTREYSEGPEQMKDGQIYKDKLEKRSVFKYKQQDESIGLIDW